MEQTLKSEEEPILREWQLNKTSTRWDWLAAAPSDEGIMRTWTALSVTTTFNALVVGTVLAAILTKKKTRSIVFNIYLVGLMIPDFIFSLVCAVICFLNLSAGHYFSASACRTQSFFEVFGITGNAWMTVVVLRQLLKLLTSAKQFKRHHPPSMDSVIKQCSIVYLWSAFVSTWGLLPEIWGIPHQTKSNSGYACFPLDYDVPSTLFYFLVFVPVISGIPLCYTIFVVYKIWREKLMPRQGQRRLIAVYLLRIVICTFVWWVPSIFFLLIFPKIPREGKVFFSVWMHFQGAASALLTLGKPDIMKAAKELLCCQSCRDSCCYPSRDRGLSSTEMSMRENSIRGGTQVLSRPSLSVTAEVSKNESNLDPAISEEPFNHSDENNGDDENNDSYGWDEDDNRCEEETENEAKTRSIWRLSSYLAREDA